MKQRTDTCIDYFEIWFQDKQGMLDTMTRNMQADVDAGYNPNGNSIVSQQLAIAEYRYLFEQQLAELSRMDSESRVQRICKYDLLKRGVIEL